MITWYVLMSKSTLRKQTVLEKNPPPPGQSIAKRTTITANLKQMTAQQVGGWPTALLCLMCATQQQKEGVLHPEGPLRKCITKLSIPGWQRENSAQLVSHAGMVSWKIRAATTLAAFFDARGEWTSDTAENPPTFTSAVMFQRHTFFESGFRVVCMCPTMRLRSFKSTSFSSCLEAFLVSSDTPSQSMIAIFYCSDL